MKNSIIKFYDDTSDYSLLEETRQYMFDTYSELEGWESLEEISDSLVYYELNELNIQFLRIEFHIKELSFYPFVQEHYSLSHLLFPFCISIIAFNHEDLLHG